MSARWRGKVAVVTGAGRGIGAATADLLAKRGCRVSLAARTGSELEKIHRRIAAEGAEYVVDEMRKVDRGGYDMTVLEGGFMESSVRTFPAGTYHVDMAQPRARAAFYFLEPEARDGMVAWWVFDETLLKLGVEKRPVVYPIFKMRRWVAPR